MRNKKAQTPEDVIFMVIIILTIGIGGLVATYAYNEFYDQVEITPVINNTAAMAAFDAGKTVNSFWDYMSLVILIGFAIGVVIIGFFIDVNSVFMPIFIIIMVIGLIVCGVVQYTWTQVSGDTFFSALTVTDFKITDHILDNIAIYYTLIAFLAFAATYMKTRVEAR